MLKVSLSVDCVKDAVLGQYETGIGSLVNVRTSDLEVYVSVVSVILVTIGTAWIY